MKWNECGPEQGVCGYQAAMFPPLCRYPGGKMRLARTIISLIPAHICYVEPFCGAAWVLFRKSPSRAEVINDASGELINLFEIIRHNPDALISRLEWTLHSRLFFQRLKEQRPENLNPPDGAFRFYYLVQSGFGGRLNNPTFGTFTTRRPANKPSRLIALIRAAHSRLEKVTIEHDGWENILGRYDRQSSFFYLDPPYYGTEGYYPGRHFTREDFPRLAAALAALRGKFLLSLNDCAATREIFAAFHIRAIANSWSIHRNNRTAAAELLISNYPLPDGTGGML